MAGRDRLHGLRGFVDMVFIVGKSLKNPQIQMGSSSLIDAHSSVWTHPYSTLYPKEAARIRAEFTKFPIIEAAHLQNREFKYWIQCRIFLQIQKWYDILQNHIRYKYEKYKRKFEWKKRLTIFTFKFLRTIFFNRTIYSDCVTNIYKIDLLNIRQRLQ